MWIFTRKPAQAQDILHPALVGGGVGGQPCSPTKSPIYRVAERAYAKCADFSKTTTPLADKLAAVFEAYLDEFAARGYRYAATADGITDKMVMINDPQAVLLFESKGRPLNCLKIANMLKMCFEWIVVPTTAEYKALTDINARQPITAPKGDDKHLNAMSMLNRYVNATRIVNGRSISTDPILKAGVIQIDRLFLTKQMGSAAHVSKGTFTCIDASVVGNVISGGSSYASTARCLFSMHAAVLVGATVYDACTRSIYPFSGAEGFDSIIETGLKPREQGGKLYMVYDQGPSPAWIFEDDPALPATPGFLKRYRQHTKLPWVSASQAHGPANKPLIGIRPV